MGRGGILIVSTSVCRSVRFHTVKLRPGCLSLPTVNMIPFPQPKPTAAGDDRYQCGDVQTMLNMIETCPFTTLKGGHMHLHSADESAVKCLTSFEA